MRPFSRSFAHAALNPSKLGLGLAREQSLLWPRGCIRLEKVSVCRQCRVQAVTAPIRFYSSQLPPNPTDKPPATSSQEDASKKVPDADVEPSPETSSHELPSTTESRRSTFNRKFSQIMDDIQLRALHATQTLNEVTGYSGIETIKAENAALEVSLAEASSRVRAARLAYKTSNTKRANTQREVTTLLARKDTWSPDDLERFTKLYRADHELEGEVAAAQEALTEAEAEEQKLNQKLNSGILRRYHEEQIWSDRIRRASTWGTWGLMGMNFLLFIMFQFVAEPWKRRRLIKGVVAEETQFLEEVRTELAALKATVEAEKESRLVEAEAEAEPAPSPVVAEVVTPIVPLGVLPVASPTWSQLLSNPALLKGAILDLFSDRAVDLRMKDASILVAEGVVAGAAVAGTVALLMLGKS